VHTNHQNTTIARYSWR